LRRTSTKEGEGLSHFCGGCATRYGIPLIAAEIEKLASESSPSAELYLHPASAIEEPSCARSTEAEGVTKVPRIYPASARQQRQEGSVTMFAVIETNGSVQNATVIPTAGKALDEAALTAVKQWKYRPTTSGITPIPVETGITINCALPQ
jgi:TonB family protein